MGPESVDKILSLLRGGQDAYFGEAVTQVEHALQCGHLARQAHASEDVVAAALLHDVGHLLAPGAELGSINHAEHGAAYLRGLGAREIVARLVSGHVQAKRYLTAVNAEYFELLSDTSRETLRQQGGPMAPEEVEAFRREPFSYEMLQLRAWNEQAKIPSLAVPDLESYRSLLESVFYKTNPASD